MSHPRTDALIAELDLCHETRIVFVLKRLIYHAEHLEEQLNAELGNPKSIDAEAAEERARLLLDAKQVWLERAEAAERALVALKAERDALEKENERCYQMLEINRVSRERAKSPSNGIGVLASRFGKQDYFYHAALDRAETAERALASAQEIAMNLQRELGKSERALAEALKPMARITTTPLGKQTNER